MRTDEEYDRIEFKYNRQNETTEVKDQNETVHAYDYDALGRQTQDRVTALGSGVDGAIRRIATTFEVRGMKEKITSYDNATVGNGAVVNEVQFAYNDFGQITADYQSHSGAVNTSTTPKVEYDYADGSANTIRQTSMTYPNGREITYDYGTENGAGDAASRVESIVDDDAGSTHLADYSYLGLNTFVEVDYTEPEVKYTLIGTAGGDDPDTGDIYRGLDRFGRVKDCYWRDYGGSTDIDRIKYGYDRNGNRVWRENVVAAANSKNFDEVYQYDQIDRLQTMNRGDLNANKDAVTSLQFAQDWALDATGNWRRFREDDDGDSSWDLSQTRDANKVNEVTGISETVGPSWATPAYDKAGNMTTMPKSSDPTQSQSATYDSWNRLVTIEEGANTIAAFEYDAAKRRNLSKSYDGGVLSQTSHLYYTDPDKWQIVEERIDSATDADRHFVWGVRYDDDLVVRDRDANPVDGSFDERFYATQDANWNVTAIIDSDGTVQERYSYASYGESSVLTPTFGGRSSTAYNWETRFAGYRLELHRTLAICIVRNRVLHPRIGTWIQRDPIGYASGDENIVRYVKNSPLVQTDPSGLRFPINPKLSPRTAMCPVGTIWLPYLGVCDVCVVVTPRYYELHPNVEPKSRNEKKSQCYCGWEKTDHRGNKYIDWEPSGKGSITKSECRSYCKGAAGTRTLKKYRWNNKEFDPDF